jgi:PAS domain S-box-containing protein
MDKILQTEKISLNLFPLSFSGGFERKFLDYYFQHSRMHVRISIIVGLFFYSIFGILDAWLVPDAKLKLWFIRYAVILPYVSLIFIFSFSQHFKRFMQPAIASALLVAGLGIIAMVSIAPYPASYCYYAGLLLVFIYGYTFFKLRFIWASVTGWLIVIAYEVAAIWLNPAPTTVLVSNNFFFLSGNILGMFACYSIEYYLRKDFMQAYLLDKEKGKVTELNTDLERRIRERTRQLVRTNQNLKQEISERTRAEDAMRESEEKYRLLIENADTAVFIIQDERIRFPNPKALELLEYSEKELLNIPLSQLVHPEDFDKFIERQNIRLTGGDPPKTCDLRISNKSKQMFWAQLNTVAIPWEGRPATLSFLRDITGQKELERRLQQAQKMEAIGTLAGGVAHDLNNILSGLVSYPELLLLDVPEESPLKRPLRTIHESGQKATAIVRDLLTLARRGVLVTEAVNLNEVIRQYLESPEHQRLLFYHPNFEVQTHLESDLPVISGSAAHLHKAIMNLVFNAAEAMPDGGKVLISTVNKYLDQASAGLEMMGEGEYVVVTIIDNGIGISGEDMDRIFEPFYSKKKMGRSGTGLGMTIVWTTVQDHKGYIAVQSSPGQGTKFKIYFPVSREVSSKTDPLIPIELNRGKGEKILIVDDIKEQRIIASEMLKKLGYEVVSVASGEEAVGYLRENTVDLVILDMIMTPGIDGLETYQKIIELRPEQAAIIASGYAETPRVKKAQQMGVGTFVSKPYSFETIGQAIKEELARHGNN